jgi:hypothetical protein
MTGVCPASQNGGMRFRFSPYAYLAIPIISQIHRDHISRSATSADQGRFGGFFIGGFMQATG